MSRVVKLLLACNLAVLAVLVFVYPNLMVGPGQLIPGHKALEVDCFACHGALRGASSEKCASCHKPADIGIRTTLGAALAKPVKTAFHQELLSQDCVGCHSDHAGVKRFARQRQFDHTLLKASTRQECQTCHKVPGDSLHKQITGNCLQCHTQTKWTPASFDHNKYFILDKDHNTRCVTCHTHNDYSTATCYGCHEHTPDNIRRKHIEEGIRKFDNCVECHRSANENDVKGRGKDSGERRGKGEGD